MSSVVSPAEVTIVGGGVIGLSCAWRLAQRGVAVTVVDPDPGRGASWAAAGMLAPVTEASYGEDELTRISLAGAAMWPSFAEELYAVTGEPVGLRDTATLAIAYDGDDGAELARFGEYAEKLFLPIQRLTGRECRAIESLLAPDVRSGLLAPDRSVHNRLLITCLLTACARERVHFVRERATRVTGHPGRVDLASGDVIWTDTAVVAAGAWSGQSLELPVEVVPPVRPVRGTILRLTTPPDLLAAGGVLSHTLRATVQGMHVYLVPREDGEIVIGATSDEVGFDNRVTAGGVWELLRDARRVLPVISELTFAEAWSGLRPVTPDNLPIIGKTSVRGIVMATGHGRNGVLLAPLTSHHITSMIVDGENSIDLQQLSPLRFSPEMASV